MTAVRHERLAQGRVLIPHPIAPKDCIGCGLDAEGSTLTTWRFFDAPGDTYPMCYWCLELWELRGWLRTAAVRVSRI